MSLLRWIQASAHHLPMLADESVQMIATSPPFFGLRSYAGEQAVEWPTVEYIPMAGLAPIRVQGCEEGCDHEWVDASYRPSGYSDNGADSSGLQGGKGTQAQTQRSVIRQAYCRHCGGWCGGLGLEERIESYIGHLILCLREWKRVLRSDGTCWVNLSDSYASNGARSNTNGSGTSGLKNDGRPEASRQHSNSIIKTKGLSLPPVAHGLKPKDLCLIPSRFALAAQADGWWVRSDIIGAKVAPMPESVRDRPTRSYEHIFLLAKAERYFFDSEAVREPVRDSSLERMRYGFDQNHSGFHKDARTGSGFEKARNGQTMEEAGLVNPAGRNLRDVWEWRPQPFAGSHFATWPEKLVETMIRAGSGAHGCCSACGKPYVRIVERTPMEIARSSRREAMGEWGRTQSSGTMTKAPTSITTGWRPDCECGASDPVPCIILDPFAGSGTTLRVAARLGRQGIGVDISQTYIEEIAPLRMGAGVQMELSY